MGYSYSTNGRLACDFCPRAEGDTRKRHCPYRWCPSPAICAECWAKPQLRALLSADKHRKCKVARDLHDAKEALAEHGIPIVQLAFADDNSVRLIIRRTVRYNADEEVLLTPTEWAPFAELFEHNPLTVQRLEQGLGRAFPSPHVNVA